MLQFTCSACGKALRVPEEMAGRTAKCPCGAAVQIPAAPTAITDSPAPAPLPIDPLAEIGTAASPRKPAQPPKRLLAIAGAVVAVLVVGFFLVRSFGSSSGITDDYPYFPEKPVFVMSARVADAMDSECFKKLKEAFPEIEKSLGEAQGEMGFPLNNLARITVAFDPSSKSPVGMMRFVKATSFDDVKSTRKPRSYRKNSKFEETKAGGAVLYQETYELDFGFGKPSGTRHKGSVYAPIDNRLMLISDGIDDLKMLLERNKGPEFTPEMKQALALADFSKTGAAAVDVKALLADGKAKRNLQREFRGMPGLDTLFDGVVCAAGDVEVGSDVHYRAVVVCKDAKSADEIKKAIDGLIALGKIAIKSNKDIPPVLAETLDSLKLSVEGTEIHASLTLKTDSVIAMVKQVKEAGERSRVEFKKVGKKIESKKQ